MYVFLLYKLWSFQNVCLSASHITLSSFANVNLVFFRANNYFEWILVTLSTENLYEFQFLCFKQSSQMTKFQILIIAASQKKGGGCRSEEYSKWKMISISQNCQQIFLTKLDLSKWIPPAYRIAKQVTTKVLRPERPLLCNFVREGLWSIYETAG